MQNPYQAQRQREEKALAQYVDVLVDTKVNEELLRVKPIQVDGLRGWNKAATKIQAWVRKCQAQRNWPEKQKQLAEEKKRRQERKETAYIPYVLRIQRQYRIYRTINLLRSYKEAKAWRLCWADSVQDQERKASALAENAIEEWSTEQVASWAQGRGLDPTVFITGCISGGILLLLDEMELSELGIKAFTERLKVMIFVKEEVDKLRGQQELERSMSVPLELFLRSPNTPPCSGWYILVEGEKVNGMPLWKRRVGAFWLFSGLRNTWLIGDKQEADEKFNCDTGFLTHPTVHNGVMPQHLKGPWDRFTLRGWAADEMIAFLTPDTIDVLLVDIVRQLQSVWRGKKARHVAAQRKEELRKKQELASAIKIQSLCRSWKAKKVRRERLLRKRAAERAALAALRNAAATKIQAMYRGASARTAVKQMRQEREGAVRKIQANFRGCQGRQRAKSRRLESKKQDVAATKIQARHRGNQDRSRAKRQLEELDRQRREWKAEMARREAAAVKIQASARGRAARREVARRREPPPPSKDDAAMVIQGRVRARAAKKDALLRKDKKLGPDAIRIQHWYRAVKQREHRRKHYKRIVQVTLLKEQLGAQTQYYKLASLRHRLVLEMEQAAARAIQDAYRGWLMRAQFHKLAAAKVALDQQVAEERRLSLERQSRAKAEKLARFREFIDWLHVFGGRKHRAAAERIQGRLVRIPQAKRLAAEKKAEHAERMRCRRAATLLQAAARRKQAYMALRRLMNVYCGRGKGAAVIEDLQQRLLEQAAQMSGLSHPHQLVDIQLRMHRLALKMSSCPLVGPYEALRLAVTPWLCSVPVRSVIVKTKRSKAEEHNSHRDQAWRSVLEESSDSEEEYMCRAHALCSDDAEEYVVQQVPQILRGEVQSVLLTLAAIDPNEGNRLLLMYRGVFNGLPVKRSWQRSSTLAVFGAFT
eukprot:TRINITY_DN8011_c0_g1_i1.p1 TRINITY_DN8011_c0_g1~~TRINITY_DN8011_c0_g1_i1.p1  ORF type:complete len:933 (+),score=221.05 TRINITY_DN8011_c0_g1_i1:166-2964(+)